MASIVDLVSPMRPSIPKPLPYSLRPSTRPGTGSSSREVSVPGPSSIWRNGAPGIKKSLPMVPFVFLLRTIDLSADAGKVLRESLSRRRRFPRLRLQAADIARRCHNNCVVYFGSDTPLKGFRPLHTASG